jgi:hypothetical protein
MPIKILRGVKMTMSIKVRKATTFALDTYNSSAAKSCVMNKASGTAAGRVLTKSFVQRKSPSEAKIVDAHGS